MKKMMAAIYSEPNRIEIQEVRIPKTAIGDALIRVHSCGICGSDLAIVSGKHPRVTPPLIIGHEFSGEIVSINSDEKSNVQIGDEVVVYPLLSCGRCFACRNGFEHVCKDLRVIGFDRDGGMAEYIVLPLDKLIKLPGSFDLDIGPLIEPLSVCVHAISMIDLKPEYKIVVLGAGPIGLLTAMVLKHQGISNLHITDISSYRLQIARKLGLQALNTNEVNIVQYMEDATSGDMADIVFEIAGVPESARQMTDLVHPRGTIVNVSVFKNQPVVDMRGINFKELTIVGSRVYTRDDFKKAIQMAPELPLREIVTHRFPLSGVANAFQMLFNNENACKVLFNFNQGSGI